MIGSFLPLLAGYRVMATVGCYEGHLAGRLILRPSHTKPPQDKDEAGHEEKYSDELEDFRG